MIVVIGVLVLEVVLLAVIVWILRAAARERAGLIDAILAKNTGELRAMRREGAPTVTPSPEVVLFEANRDAELIEMGYDPRSVPRVPSGLDGR